MVDTSPLTASSDQGGSVKRRILRWVLPALVVGAALAITGAATGKIGGSKGASALPASSCGTLQYGGSGKPQFIVPSDLPLQGSSRSQTIEMTKAINFELKSHGYKAGKYTVGYQSCDDSTAQAGKWDPAKCSANAQLYSRTKEVIAVIGTFNSGCAEIEVPIANRVSLQYVSPANTYIGLTHRPALPGEPNKYYPTGKRTYARVRLEPRLQHVVQQHADRQLQAEQERRHERRRDQLLPRQEQGRRLLQD